MLHVAPDSAADGIYGDHIDRVASNQMFLCGVWVGGAEAVEACGPTVNGDRWLR